jgi:hypothetical protein
MTEALTGQPDAWYAVPPTLHALNVNGYTAYLIPGTEQVAQSQQPPPPPACDEDCGGGGGGDNQGRHKKH